LFRDDENVLLATRRFERTVVSVFGDVVSLFADVVSVFGDVVSVLRESVSVNRDVRRVVRPDGFRPDRTDDPRDRARSPWEGALRACYGTH